MFELIKIMFPYLKPYLKSGILALVLYIPLAAIKGAHAYLIKPIIDKGFSPDATREDALILAGIFVGLAVVNYPIRFFHYYTIRMIVDRSTCSIRSVLYRKLQNVNSFAFGDQKSGNLISIAGNDTQIFSEAFNQAFNLIREPLSALVLLGIAFYHDWQLATVIFIITPMFYVILKITGNKLRKYVYEAQLSAGEMTHSIAEGITGNKIIKAFNLQKYMISRFHMAQDRYLDFRKKTNAVEEHSHPLIEVVGAIAFAVIIVFAHHRISRGHLTMGSFISFLAVLAMFMEPVRKYSKANAKLNQARAALKRMLSLLDLEEENNVGRKKTEKLQDKIVIANLNFSYGDHKVLKNINLTINRGEKIGLVGLSGSGKSTMVSLLLRLYDSYDGQIKLDDNEIREFELNNYRDLFALVSQDVFLFNDTIRENLTAGNDYSDEEIKKALEISYADEYINKLESGLETEIGDRGVKLSGGQAQRLTIARAFLRNSDIILFDEATSALDNESEKVVQKAMEEMAKNKTVIAVAHRLSTIQDYDRIIVMKDGEIVEEGSHEALMNLSGEYSKLYQLSNKE